MNRTKMPLLSLALAALIATASVVVACHRMAQADTIASRADMDVAGAMLVSSQEQECCMFATHANALPTWFTAPVPQERHVHALLVLLFTTLAFTAATILARIRAGPAFAAEALAPAPITPLYLRAAFARGILHPKLF